MLAMVSKRGPWLAILFFKQIQVKLQQTVLICQKYSLFFRDQLSKIFSLDHVTISRDNLFRPAEFC